MEGVCDIITVLAEQQTERERWEKRKKQNNVSKYGNREENRGKLGQ